MPRGNPNPIPQWTKGQSGNPGGKTSEQRKLEVRNAEIATRIRNRMLESLDRLLQAAEQTGDAAVVARIEADILRLLKDAEDRGLGSPKATVDLSVTDVAEYQDAVLAALSKEDDADA